MANLKNLHDIIRDAQFIEHVYATTGQRLNETARRREREIAVQSFQVDLELKRHIDTICRGNGTTASAFLRECCSRLVSEYTGIEIGSLEWIMCYGKQQGIE